MVEHILSIFQKYGLREVEVKKHVVFLTDRGPNVKYGLIQVGFTRLNCYAHLIHNLVSCMLNWSGIKSMIQQCADLSSYVKSSGLNTKLKTSLKRHTTTRWNSTFIMIDAILTNFEDVYELLIIKQRLRNEARAKSYKPPDSEISDLITSINPTVLKSLRTFLEPFKVKNFF